MVRESLTRERNLNSLLAVLKFHIPENKEVKRAFDKLKEARNMNAVMLHHDAITGTHGSSVQQDYKRILGDVKRAMDDAGVIMNVSESFTGTYDVVLFNPSAYIREEIISMTVNSDKIVASSDQPTQFELHPQMIMNP